MGPGNRFFWWFYTMIVIGLLWLRFVKPYLSIWGALIISLILFPIFMWYKIVKDTLRKRIRRNNMKTVTS